MAATARSSGVRFIPGRVVVVVVAGAVVAGCVAGGIVSVVGSNGGISCCALRILDQLQRHHAPREFPPADLHRVPLDNHVRGVPRKRVVHDQPHPPRLERIRHRQPDRIHTDAPDVRPLDVVIVQPRARAQVDDDEIVLPQIILKELPDIATAPAE